MHRLLIVLAAVGCGPSVKGGESTATSTPAAAVAATPDEATSADSEAASPDSSPGRIVWTFAERLENSSALRDLEAECSRAAVALVEKTGVTDVSHCEVLRYRHGDRSLYLVQLDYGPVMDCPSGCIQDSVSGVVEGDVVRLGRIPYAGGGTAHGHIKGALASVLPDLGIDNPERYEWYDVPGGFPCANDQKPLLVSRGSDLEWEFDLTDGPRCLARLPGPGVTPLGVEVVLTGRVTVPIFRAGGRAGQHDYSETNVEVVRKP